VDKVGCERIAHPDRPDSRWEREKGRDPPRLITQREKTKLVTNTLFQKRGLGGRGIREVSSNSGKKEGIPESDQLGEPRALHLLRKRGDALIR